MKSLLIHLSLNSHLLFSERTWHSTVLNGVDCDNGRTISSFSPHFTALTSLLTFCCSFIFEFIFVMFARCIGESSAWHSMIFSRCTKCKFILVFKKPYFYLFSLASLIRQASVSFETLLFCPSVFCMCAHLFGACVYLSRTFSS